MQCQDFLNFCCLVPNHHTLHRKESNLKNYFMTKNIERKYEVDKDKTTLQRVGSAIILEQ